MNNPPKNTRITNKQILSELQHLRRELCLTSREEAFSSSQQNCSHLRPYLIAEGDTRYLSEQQASSRERPRPKIRESEDVSRFCQEHFGPLIERGLQEEFHIITLDGAHQVIRTHQVTIGIANSTQVHPREVFRPAILDAACGVILIHNHPSGDVTPSPSDIAATKLMAEASRVLGIKLLDHLILGRGGCFSFAESTSHSDSLRYTLRGQQ